MLKLILRRVLQGFLMLFCIAAGAAIGFAGVYYVADYLPVVTYQQASASPYKDFNARLLSFKSATDFGNAEAWLYRKLQNSENVANPLFYYCLGSLFEARQEDAQAVETYKALLKVANRDPFRAQVNRYFSEDAHASLAWIYYRHGKLEAARHQLAAIPDLGTLKHPEQWQALQAVLDEPPRGDYHFELGKVFRQQLDLPMARREFETALSQAQSPDLRNQIQNFLTAKMPSRTRQLSPMARYFALAGSQIEDRAQKPETLTQAIRYYEQSLQEAPDFEWGYQQIAHAYQSQDALPKARQYAERALVYNPNLYLSHLSLGDIALAEGEYDEAALHFTKAQTILSGLKDDYHQALLVNVENQLGFAQELRSQLSLALKHYETALHIANELDGSNTEDLAYAREGIARAHMLLKQTRLRQQILAQK